MTNYDDVCRAYIDKALGLEVKPRKTERVFYNGDDLYSYGYHFILATTLRNKYRQFQGFLLNGDNHSSSTSNHQSCIRAAVQRSKERHVIIPFSALSAAGIQFASISIVEVTTDTNEVIVEEYDTLPPGVTIEWLPTFGYIESPVGGNDTYGETGHRRAALQGRHIEWEMTTMPDGHTHYRRERTRHWLGESLIRARVEYYPRSPQGNWQPMRTRWAYFLSGFDHNETRRSYFFCELPSGVKPTTVAEAYDTLKPRAVTAAEAAGREVKRQGDIFAIPINVTTRRLKAPAFSVATMGTLLETNHRATEVRYEQGKRGVTYARGFLHHDPAGRRPDHSRVKLGNQWHLIVKNTVPLGA